MYNQPALAVASCKKYIKTKVHWRAQRACNQELKMLGFHGRGHRTCVSKANRCRACKEPFKQSRLLPTIAAKFTASCWSSKRVPGYWVLRPKHSVPPIPFIPTCSKRWALGCMLSIESRWTYGGTDWRGWQSRCAEHILQAARMLLRPYMTRVLWHQHSLASLLAHAGQPVRISVWLAKSCA